MDTARAQTVFEDDSRNLMPELVSIRSESATFENSITTGPWTVPSHASMFTGQRTSSHRTDSRAEHFDPDGPPLAERLQRGGHRTTAFSNNNWVSEELGFDRGFGEFRGMWNLSSEGVPVLNVIDGCDTHTGRLLALAKATDIIKIPPTLLNTLYRSFFRNYLRYINYIL